MPLLPGEAACESQKGGKIVFFLRNIIQACTGT